MFAEAVAWQNVPNSRPGRQGGGGGGESGVRWCGSIALRGTWSGLLSRTEMSHLAAGPCVATSWGAAVGRFNSWLVTRVQSPSRLRCLPRPHPLCQGRSVERFNLPTLRDRHGLLLSHSRDLGPLPPLIPPNTHTH